MVRWCHHFTINILFIYLFFLSLRASIASIRLVYWWWFPAVLDIILQRGWTTVRYVYCQVWWGCNVCRQWRAVDMAAAMRHLNRISLISPKWSSQLEVFPNYLTHISQTKRLIPLFFPESRRWSLLSFQTYTGFYGFLWFIWWFSFLQQYHVLDIAALKLLWRCQRRHRRQITRSNSQKA